MSIWGSQEPVGYADEFVEDDEPNPRGGQVRSYIVGWSNHYPDDTEVESSVELAHMMAWVVPGHPDHSGVVDGNPVFGPWLRLGLDTVDHHVHAEWENGPDGARLVKPTEVRIGDDVRTSVVLDEDAVRQLRDDLTAWLDTPKVHPHVT